MRVVCSSHSSARQWLDTSPTGVGLSPADAGLAIPTRGYSFATRDLFEESVPRQPISVGARLPRPCTGTTRRVVAAAGASHDDRIPGTSCAPLTWLQRGTGGNSQRSTAVAPQSSRRPRLTTTYAFVLASVVRAYRLERRARRPPWRIYFICRPGGWRARRWPGRGRLRRKQRHGRAP
jgi:hypothetical protein